MTKKIFAMFLAVLMVISMLPVSAMADTADCPVKGNHTVENCSYTVVKVTEPTCGAMGYTSYKCNKCGEIFVANRVAATGEHNFVDDAKTYIAPTCGAYGNEAGQKCTVCGEVKPGKLIPAVGELGTPCEMILKTPNINCLTGGVKVWECASCGKQETLKVEAKESHNFDNDHAVLLKPATATENGLAKVTCVDCREEKEVTVYFKHSCEGMLVYIPEVPANCTKGTNGVKAYYQCRICDKKYDAVTPTAVIGDAVKKDEDLVIAFKHDFRTAPGGATTEPNCLVSNLWCETCQKYIEVDSADQHKFSSWSTVPGRVATCIANGAEQRVCTVCNIAAETRIVKALGHKTVTVSVPATCATAAYSYTYCVNEGCAQSTANKLAAATAEFGGKYSFTATRFDRVLFTPVAGVAYTIGQQINELEDVFVDGTLNDKGGFNYTHDFQKAAKFFIEYVHCAAENSFRMYMVNAEGVNIYLKVTASKVTGGYKTVVTLTSDAKSATNFSWNNALAYVYSTVKYANLNMMLSAEGKDETPASIVDYKINVDKDGKEILNPSAHDLTRIDLINPSCTSTGTYVMECKNCGDRQEFTSPAAHSWVAAEGETGFGVDKKQAAAKPAGCEDGWQWYVCSVAGCNATKVETTKGIGHKTSAVKEHKATHTDPNGFKFTYCECATCNGTSEIIDGREYHNVVKSNFSSFNYLEQFTSVEDAQKAHGNSLLYKTEIAGNCTTAKKVVYTCTESDCKCSQINVMVLITEPGSGQHSLPTTKTAPTCTTEGYYVTYKCTFCDAQVGAGTVNETQNKIAALGHTFENNKDYKAAAHDAPNYDNVVKTCKVCHLDVNDGTELIKLVSEGTKCGTTTYEYYKCWCGEEHMRSFITALEHDFVNLTGPNYYNAPTCFSKGLQWQECKFCGMYNRVYLDMVPHTNAAGEKFTDLCTDTTEDRHCVVCHEKHIHLGAILPEDHDCTKKDHTCSCVIKAVCHGADVLMPSTCLESAYTLNVCPDCGKETFKAYTGDLMHSGHMPEAAGEEHYNNYVYVEDFEWFGIEIDHDDFAQASATYTAKFDEYVAPTLAADGYWTGKCVNCDMTVTQVMPKLTGVGVELKAANAIAAAKGVTFGSLVAVDVVFNAVDMAVWGAQIEVDFGGDVIFVGAESSSEQFVVTTTDVEKANDYRCVAIAVNAENDATGKRADVVIAEETTVVTLFFRVSRNSNIRRVDDEIKFEVDVDMLVNAKGENVEHFSKDAAVKYVKLGDMNGNGTTNILDVMQAVDMLLGEVEGKTYDVAMDFDRDGEITLADLFACKNMLVGNADMQELFFNGMSAEEKALIESMLMKEYVCPQCGTHFSAGDRYCINCGKLLVG